MHFSQRPLPSCPPVHPGRGRRRPPWACSRQTWRRTRPAAGGQDRSQSTAQHQLVRAAGSVVERALRHTPRARCKQKRVKSPAPSWVFRASRRPQTGGPAALQQPPLPTCTVRWRVRATLRCATPALRAKTDKGKLVSDAAATWCKAPEAAAAAAAAASELPASESSQSNPGIRAGPRRNARAAAPMRWSYRVTRTAAALAMISACLGQSGWRGASDVADGLGTPITNTGRPICCGRRAAPHACGWSATSDQLLATPGPAGHNNPQWWTWTR